LLLPYFSRRTELAANNGDSQGQGQQQQQQGGKLGSEKYARAVEALCSEAEKEFETSKDIAGKEVKSTSTSTFITTYTLNLLAHYLEHQLEHQLQLQLELGGSSRASVCP
jgi:hypothetical protein